jgi:hypothetical protein
VDGDLLHWIRGRLWSDPWGVFAVTDADLGTLRRHFRRFLRVLDPSGQQMYFRYYDPRVLRAFLPTCSPGQLREFFGPIKAYGIPDADSGDVLLYTTGEGPGPDV